MKQTITLLMSIFMVTVSSAKNHSAIRSLLKSGGLTTKLDSIVFEYADVGAYQTDVAFYFDYDTSGIPVAVHEFEDGDFYDWEISYNENGQVEYLLSSYENQEDAKIEFTYDNDGNCISETESYFDEEYNMMVDDLKIVYTYEDGKLISYQGLDWDIAHQQWSDHSTSIGKTLIFQPGDVVVSDTLFRWNSTDQEYKYSYLNDYNYSMDGDELVLDRKMQYEWNPTSQTFERYYMWSYTYDDNDNLIRENLSTPGTTETNWVTDGYYEYIYNDTITTTETSFPIYYNFETEEIMYTNVPTMVKYYFVYDGDYVTEDRTMYYYSEIALGADTTGNSGNIDTTGTGNGVSINEISQDIKVVIGENISFNIPNAESANLTIYSISGQPVYSGAINNNVSIATSDFATGLYIYSIITKGKVTSGKILVE